MNSRDDSDQWAAQTWLQAFQRQQQSYVPFPRSKQKDAKTDDASLSSPRNTVYCIMLDSANVRLPKAMKTKKTKEWTGGRVEAKVQYRCTLFDSKTRTFFGNTYMSPFLPVEAKEGYKELKKCMRKTPVYFHTHPLDKYCALVTEVVLVHQQSHSGNNKGSYVQPSTADAGTTSRHFPAVSLGWTIVPFSELASKAQTIEPNDDSIPTENPQTIQLLKGTPRALLHSPKQPAMSPYMGDPKNLLSAGNWNKKSTDCSISFSTWIIPGLAPIADILAPMQLVGAETEIPGISGDSSRSRSVLGLSAGGKIPRTVCSLEKRVVLKVSRAVVRLCKGFENNLLDYGRRWADQWLNKPMKTQNSTSVSIGRWDLLCTVHNMYAVQETAIMPLESYYSDEKAHAGDYMRATTECYLNSCRLHKNVAIMFHLIARLDFDEIVWYDTSEIDRLLKADSISPLGKYLKNVDGSEFQYCSSKYVCLGSQVFPLFDGFNMKLSNGSNGGGKYISNCSLELPLISPANDSAPPDKLLLPGSEGRETWLLHQRTSKHVFSKGNIIVGCKLEPCSQSGTRAPASLQSNRRLTKKIGEKVEQTTKDDIVKKPKKGGKSCSKTDATDQRAVKDSEVMQEAPEDEGNNEKDDGRSLDSYKSTEDDRESDNASSEASFQFSDSYEDAYESGHPAAGKSLSTDLVNRTFQLPVTSADNETPQSRRQLPSSEASSKSTAKTGESTPEGTLTPTGSKSKDWGKARYTLPVTQPDFFRPLGGYIARTARTRLAGYGHNTVLDASHDAPSSSKLVAKLSGKQFDEDHRTKDREYQEQLSRIDALQSLIWTPANCGLSVLDNEITTLDLSLELSDPLQRNSISIQFCSLIPNGTSSNAVASLDLNRVLLTFSFYTVHGMRIPVECVKDEKTNENYCIYVLRAASSSSQQPKTAKVYPAEKVAFEVDIDVGNCSMDAKRDLFNYLYHHSVQVEVWNADSMMMIGSFFVPLYNFLRQQKDETITAREFDIIGIDPMSTSTNSPGEQLPKFSSSGAVGHSSTFSAPNRPIVQGRVQTLLCNVGKPTKNSKESKEGLTTRFHQSHSLMSSFSHGNIRELRKQRVVSTARPLSIENSGSLDLVKSRGAGKPLQNQSKVLVTASKKKLRRGTSPIRHSFHQLKSENASREGVISYEELQSLYKIFGEEAVSIDKFVYFVTGIETVRERGGAVSTLEDAERDNADVDDHLELKVYDAVSSHLDRLRVREKLKPDDPSLSIGDSHSDRGSLVFQAFEVEEKYVRRKQKAAGDYKQQKPSKRRSRKDSDDSSDYSEYLSDEDNPEVYAHKEHSLLTSGETHIPLEREELTVGRLRYIFTKTLKLKLTEEEWESLIERFVKPIARRRAKGSAKYKPELMVINYKDLVNNVLDSALTKRKKERHSKYLEKSSEVDLEKWIQENPSLMVTRGKILRALSHCGRGHSVTAAYFLRAILRTMDWKGVAQIEWRHLATACEEYLDLVFELSRGKLGVESVYKDSSAFDKNLWKQSYDDAGQSNSQFSLSQAERQFGRSIEDKENLRVSDSIWVPKEVIESYKEAHKRDNIRRMLHSQLTTEYLVPCTFGVVSFFEHTIINPLPHDDRISVNISDPCGELALVTDLAQWNHLREFARPSCEDQGLESLRRYQSIPRDGGPRQLAFTSDNDLILRPGEVVTLPFVFVSFDHDQFQGRSGSSERVPPAFVQTGKTLNEQPSSPFPLFSRKMNESVPLGHGEQTLQEYQGHETDIIVHQNDANWNERSSCRDVRLPLDSREIIVTVSSSVHARAFARLCVRMDPQPFIEHKLLRYFMPEGEYFTANLAVPERVLHAHSVSDVDWRTYRVTEISGTVEGKRSQSKVYPEATTTGNFGKYLFCPEENVLLKSEQVGYSKEIQFQYRPGRFPSVEDFYILVYEDYYCCHLAERWHVYVYPLKKCSLQTFAGQRAHANIAIPGDVKSRAVRLHISPTDALEVVGTPDVSLVPNKYSEVKLKFEPLKAGMHHFQVNVVGKSENAFLGFDVAQSI